MSKPYMDVDLADQLSRDRTWRLREISDLKTATIRADTGLKQVLLRSLVAISYAHWEGFVRFSAKKYLEHISLRKLPYSQLDRQFFINYFIPRLTSAEASKTSISNKCQLIDDILDSRDKRFSKVNEDLVNTRANLNFQVFSDICKICGVSTQPFAPKANFMDVVLLKRRNSIAHGEDTLIGIEDLNEISDETVGLMRAFGDALENAAYLQSYKVA